MLTADCFQMSIVESKRPEQSGASADSWVLCFLGSSGVQILATIVLLGPKPRRFSSVHESEWPAKGGYPYASASDMPAGSKTLNSVKCPAKTSKYCNGSKIIINLIRELKEMVPSH